MDLSLMELIHRQIILDMTLRTLEVDRQRISNLKMTRVWQIWYEEKVKEVQQELITVKKNLGNKGVKIQSEKKVDELITEYTVIEKGELFTKRYMNIALRNWVEEEMKRLLHLPYVTTENYT